MCRRNPSYFSSEMVYYTTLLCLAVLFSISAVSCIQQEEIVAKCKVKHAFDGEFTDIDFNADVTGEIKCFLACLLLEDGILSESGELDWDVERDSIVAQFEEDPDNMSLFSQIHESCAKIVIPQGENCETGFQYMKCKYDEIQK